jgi:hypothetical protein
MLGTPPWFTAWDRIVDWLAGRPNDGPTGDKLWARRTLYEAGIFMGTAAVMLLYNRSLFPKINEWIVIAIVAVSVWLGIRSVNRWEQRQRAALPQSKTTIDKLKTTPDPSKTGPDKQ